jgi:hypothetical protein
MTTTPDSQPLSDEAKRLLDQGKAIGNVAKALEVFYQASARAPFTERPTPTISFTTTTNS